MKLVDNKKILLIVVALIGGLIFATYLLYEQKGQIGKTEIISLSITAVVAILIAIIMIRRANK